MLQGAFHQRSSPRKQLETCCLTSAPRELPGCALRGTPPGVPSRSKPRALDRQERVGFCRVAKRAVGRQWSPKAESCCAESARRTDLPPPPPRREREPAEEIEELRNIPIQQFRAKEGSRLVYSPGTLSLSNLRRYFNRLRPRRISRFKRSGAGEARGSRPSQPGQPPRSRFQSFHWLSRGACVYRPDHDLQPLRCGALEQRSNRLTGKVFSRFLA